MTRAPRVAIDLLGSDTPPEKLLHAVIDALPQLSHPPELSVFGTKELFAHVKVPPSIRCFEAAEAILMEDDPLIVVRRKKNSSLCMAIRALKNYEIDALITAGNTGALLASAALELPMLPGIERPALMTLIPTKKEPLSVLDVGANVSVTPDQLVQFASMGVAYQKTRGVEKPAIGLLNIGAEKKKGTPELREAYALLQKKFDTFAGNVEGVDVFNGEIDVLVTDGFSGNIFLKTAEGLAAFILDLVRKEERSDLFSALYHRLSYDAYPGAILCGVDGIVMKCHGRSSATALIHSITGAARLYQHFFLEKIKYELSQK
jgi:glycerol-3-phosphate acyltransferase PlsX